MPRIYRNFEEFERHELVAEGVSIDEMLDDMFAEELDVSFTSEPGNARSMKAALKTASKSAEDTLDELDL